ncbi:glycoside hydrolase family 15 protein [Phycicoccus sp. MAQZ13P-2]|uniref:glycoside hydrolase family 15 protein n=1 Tax=Phycicoccus mangrovi TaxID=2840470 RepID=UPI001C005191|nr:glycoside hydrolase family 15 protein [Phycicoccus mangrovi]MBT9254617.1 glycoside hydrolase family 15 protein [Phycicoccus mangrovi]MBT9273178.1 glycoside hydrolase family 15 protein [Phycicoccus mangrovi]
MTASTSRMPVEFAPHVLREYALLADGHRGAVIGPRGDVGWMCAPGWDDEPLFAQLVGGAGVFAVTPSRRCVWGGYYEPGSLIWRSRWTTDVGIVECREALAAPAHERTAVVLRRVEPLDEAAELDVVLRPAAGFGAGRRLSWQVEGGVWTVRAGGRRLRLSGVAGGHVDDHGVLRARLSVPPGTRHDLVLEVSEGRLRGRPPDPDQLWEETRAYWNESVPDLTGSVAPRDAQHAYAVLRGLTAPGGGMVAAATVGMPERAEAGRNYDYRYVWLRDQAYAGLAAAVAEPHGLLDEAVRFTTARVLERGPDLAPAYRLDGSLPPRERHRRVPGYPGGRVVTGNWVRGQFQLDTVGELLQLYAAAGRHDRLQTDDVRAVSALVDLARDRWTEPDAGVWELEDAWWTHSRLACVAGLRSAASVVARSEASRLETLADGILAETSRRCLRPDGAWRRAPGLHGVDASLLLAPVRGALPAADPRSAATLDAVTRELVQDGFVYRYRPDERPLGDAEGAFLMCGFAMSLALLEGGDRIGAFRWFERQRSACGPPGLFSEEFDVRQRQLRGNLPQGFVHALLLETAQRLA